jgi:peroxiredoxin Q/BCP
MKLLALAVTTAALIATAGRANAADGPAVGDAAPGFSLVGSDGQTYSLADFKDKQAIVLAWFPKAFTGG